MGRLRIAGTYNGAIEVDFDQWTVGNLKEEVARLSNRPLDTIKLICSGKVLKDDDRDKKLSELGVPDNSKVLASRISLQEGNSLRHELMAEDERQTRLARLKSVPLPLSLLKIVFI